MKHVRFIDGDSSDSTTLDESELLGKGLKSTRRAEVEVVVLVLDERSLDVKLTAYASYGEDLRYSLGVSDLSIRLML